MDEIIKQSTELYYEIDDCITRLLKSRLDKDANKENVALFDMESLLINTMQHISWMVNELKGNSKIKWQTGEPQESGEYLITTYNGKVRIDEFYFYSVSGKEYGTFIKYANPIAWCKLSDIVPYKEESL